MGRLDGKVALITGSTQGVGEGIATKFVREGAFEVINGRSADKGERTLERLRAISSESALFFQADVGRKEVAQKLVADAIAAFGSIDILVNNALVMDFFKRSEDDTVDRSLDVMMPVGLYAPLWASQAAFRWMRDRGGGRILNFGSTAGVMGNRYSAAYNTLKEAIRGLTRTLAQEWGRYNTH